MQCSAISAVECNVVECSAVAALHTVSNCRPEPCTVSWPASHQPTLLDSNLLYCFVLYCIYSNVVYSTVLYSTALYCTVLHCAVSTLIYCTLLYCRWFFSKFCLIFLVSDQEKVAEGMEEESDQNMFLQVLYDGIGSKSARRSSMGIVKNGKN